MSRLLADLEPVTREKVYRLIAAAPLVLGRELFIVHTLRTYEEQDELYAQGRTKPGKKVTDARGGQSWHNFGRAIDFAFEERGTQRPTWSTAGDAIEDWRLLGQMGEAIGLEWGGRFEGLGDFGHFHYSAGMPLDRARALFEQQNGASS